MVPRILLGTAVIPGTDKELQLFQSGDVFSIKIPGRGDLMNSRVHGSENALAELACAKMGPRRQPRLLIGGLGMGFTLAAALKTVGPDAEVVVAELVPEVVEWNRTLIGAPAGHPLTDPRSRVYVGDVGDLIRAKRGRIRRHSDGCRQRARSAGAARERLAVRRRRPASDARRAAPARRAGGLVGQPGSSLLASDYGRPASTCMSTSCARIARVRDRGTLFG